MHLNQDSTREGNWILSACNWRIILYSWLLQEVFRIKAEHPDDNQAILNDRVKGQLKVTRAFGAGFLKKVSSAGNFYLQTIILSNTQVCIIFFLVSLNFVWIYLFFKLYRHENGYRSTFYKYVCVSVSYKFSFINRLLVYNCRILIRCQRRKNETQNVETQSIIFTKEGKSWMHF